MPRLINNAHAALTKKFENLIVASQGGSDQRVFYDAYKGCAVVRTRRNDASELAIALETDFTVETVMEMF
jgi:hypothetical protein